MTPNRTMACVAGLMLVLVAGCQGTIGGVGSDGKDTDDSWQTMAPDPCLSDPDLPGTVVCDAGTQWSCVVADGAGACARRTSTTCRGRHVGLDVHRHGRVHPVRSHDDRCAHRESRVDLPPERVRQAGVRVQRPRRARAWAAPGTCVYDDVSGVTCTATDTGEWGCWQEGDAVKCHKDDATRPNDQPGLGLRAAGRWRDLPQQDRRRVGRLPRAGPA